MAFHVHQHANHASAARSPRVGLPHSRPSGRNNALVLRGADMHCCLTNGNVDSASP